MVSLAYRLGSAGSSKILDSPQALTDRTEVNVDLYFVVLKSDQRKGKTRVAAEPELKRNVKGGLRKSVTGSAYLRRSTSSGTRTRYVSEGRIGNVGQLGGVSNHLVVTVLLFLGKGKLVPDVHPVTILTVNALTTNLNLNLSNQLLTREIQPTSIDSTGGTSHVLVDLGKSYLKVGTVSKITVSADGAGNTATEVGLTRKGLFDAFHSKVSVTSVRYFPEGDFRGSGKEHVLGAIGDKLH